MATGKAPAGSPAVRAASAALTEQLPDALAVALRAAWRHRAVLATASWSPVLFSAVRPLEGHPIDLAGVSLTTPRDAAFAAAGVAAAASLRSWQASDAHRARRMRSKIGRACLMNGALCRLPVEKGAPYRAPIMTMPVRTLSGWQVDVRVPDHTATEAYQQLLPVLETTLAAQITIEPIAGPRKRDKAKAVVSRRVPKRGRRTPKASTAVAVRGVKSAPRRVARGWIRLKIREVDVLASVTPYWPELERIADPSRPDATIDLDDGFSLGVDEDAVTAILRLVERNLLIGGLMGYGKSNVLQIVCAAAACDPDVDLFLIDPSGGVELSRWRDLAAGSADTPEEAVELLAELQVRGDASLAAYAAQRRRALNRGDRLTLIVVDELQSLTAHEDSDVRKAVGRSLMDIVGRFRKVGFVCVLATLRPTHDVVPTSLRDLIMYRLALRCATPVASDVILGDAWAGRGFDASDGAMLPEDVKGLGFLAAGGAAPRRIRTPHLDDAALDRIHAHAAALRGVDLRVPAVRPSPPSRPAPAPEVPRLSKPPRSRPGPHRRRLHGANPDGTWPTPGVAE